MTTTIIEPVFVDTNILVYANITAAPECLLAQTRLRELADDAQTTHRYPRFAGRPRMEACREPKKWVSRIPNWCPAP
jgi:hypothetical protein